MDAISGEPIDVALRLVPERNPGGVVHVAGTARQGSAPPRSFSGWMALLQVLEAMVDGGPPDDDPSDGEH